MNDDVMSNKNTPVFEFFEIKGNNRIFDSVNFDRSACFAGFAHGNFCYRITGACARDYVEGRGLPKDRALWFWQFHNLSIGRTAHCARPVGDRY
ncbi:MAG: hypothetical protein GY845_06110 [Planctomycetes bacterium]|nr:hypothetical protein [Planctomycetota bacterium]